MTIRTDTIWEYVSDVHRNQSYGSHTNAYVERHLKTVWHILCNAQMDTETDEIIAASHDVIEDAGDRDEVISFLRAYLTDFEFNVVWAMTGVGSNRKERNANAKSKIMAFPAAANYKVADRVANLNASKFDEKKLAMYQKEAEDFRSILDLATSFALVEQYHQLINGVRHGTV